MPTILLVEDDPLLGAMIREMLEGCEFRVAWVRTGLPVRRMITEDPAPDLIITDILMPDMDGLETISCIRAARPGLPVIAMSAEVKAGYLDLAARMGALAVLQKPFTQETLLATISGLLGRDPCPELHP